VTIVRREHRDNFTIVPNAMFLDERLSVEAKGVLGFLLSRPHKWQVRLDHIGRTLRVGRKKLQRIFRELISAGYVTREQQRILDGHRFGEMDYVVRDVSDSTHITTVMQPVDNLPIPEDRKGPAVPRVQKGPAYKEPPRVQKGLREIDEDQADVVRRIFSEYALGRSARTIAAGLNRDGLPSPFGYHWAASTINGNLKRHSGLLYNEAYIGFLVFNRIAMIKNPETGKRISRPNPPEKWQVVAAPHLRIIQDEVWDAVQARKKIYGGKRTHERRRPRHMFSGLVRCGACGGSYTIKNRDQLACSAHREKGTCDNNRTIRVAELERRVLEGIERRLLAPEIIAEFLKEYHSEQRRLRKEANRQRHEADKRVHDLDRHISNIIDAIAEGVATSGMKAKLIELEGEKEVISAKMATFSQAGNVVEFHPATVEAYRKKVAELQAALTSDEPGRREAMEIVRSLVNGIQIVPLDGRGQVELRVCGALAELLNLPSRQSGEPPSAAMVVAEEGLEPPTRGL
jgi:site-specific DNA recombinase